MPSIERYTPKTLQREWGTEQFIAETPLYLGKILTMHEGTKGGLQKHVEKVESFHLVSGKTRVRFDAGNGLVTRGMRPGETIHVPAGAVHQVLADTECVFFEVSTPHYDDRVRMEAHYGEQEHGGLPTTR